MTTRTEPLVLSELPPLPDGWEPAETAPVPLLVDEEQPEPPTPKPAPPQSGVLDAVSGVTGQPVTLHRAEYTVLSPQGGWTNHGYAWCCRNTACRLVTTGYPGDGYARAHADAEAHDCRTVRHG